MAKRKANVETPEDVDSYDVAPRPPKKTKLVKMYEVEVIMAARVGDDLQYEYFVKWFGYSERENTWEPYESVASCTRLLRSFWASIAYEHNRYPIDHIIKPSQEWIRSEKTFYRSVVRNAHIRLGMSKQKKSEMVLCKS